MATLHLLVLSLACCFSLAAATPLVNDPRSAPLPVLKLPYASYRAAHYDALSDIYTFKNIRYAAPPVGDLRWAKPAPPQAETTVQDGSYGHSCVQASLRSFNVLGSGNGSPIGAAVNQFLAGIPIPLFKTGNEDCLFLDLYVPGKALRSPSSSKLPVLVWVFGGGYVLGSKDAMQPQLPFYDGSGLISETPGGDGIIFVAMNYRLGAYGFLAGTTMESAALPNAGLWDQRAALQWVQDHISLVGGDPAQVTAMGESAGAGSLVHHLVAGGGTVDPLFSRAILQSPAYQWMWDRAGTVENTFRTFASLAGCGSSTDGSSTLACLRAADPAVLATANKELMDTVPEGSFAVGPTVDGTYIRQLPVLELATGNYAKSVKALIMSHCANDATFFVSGTIDTDDEFTAFLDGIFPNYTHKATAAASGGGSSSEKSVTEQILAFYPPVSGASTAAAPSGQGPFHTESARVEAFLRDSCFVCNVRYLTEAYGDSSVWNMQYSVTPGWHGSDLLPTFYTAKGLTAASIDSWLEDLATLLVPAVGLLLSGLSRAMQSYFASFVTTGNPNTHRAVLNLPPSISWGHPSSTGEQITGVLDVGNLGFHSVNDPQGGKTPCDFWRNVAAAVTSQGGYAPPGDVVPQSLVTVTNDPSANYVGGNGGK